MNPCRNPKGEIICEKADLPYCRQTCETYKEYDRERIRRCNLKIDRAENEADQYFREKNLKNKNRRAKNLKNKASRG